MNNIGGRIKQLRRYLKLTQVQFSEKIGVTHGYLSNTEKGRTQLTIDRLVSIRNIFNVNGDWLLSGKGEMFLSGDKESLFNPIQDEIKRMTVDMTEDEMHEIILLLRKVDEFIKLRKEVKQLREDIKKLKKNK